MIGKSKTAVLAFDLGATSGRAIMGCLEDGLIQIEEIHRFPNEPVRYNGEMHWDMPRLWREMQFALQSFGARGEPLCGIGVDTWGVDYALLGEHGTLLENPYHYRDRRTEGMVAKAVAVLTAERIYDTTGIQFLALNTLYQLYAASQKTPGLLAAAQSLVTIPDLLNYWLTGNVGCEYTIASTTQFLNRRTRQWASDLLRDLGIPTHLLTPIIQPGTVIGGLRPEMAQHPALARAQAVAPGCHDTASAVAAVKASGRTAFLSSGTWSLLGTEVREAIATPESLRLNFTNEGGVNETVRLLKNLTGLYLVEGCRKTWEAVGQAQPYATLLEMATAAEPLRCLIDPDDPSFGDPDNMPRAIDEYCRRTEQPAPRSPGEYVRTILESLALKYRLILDQLETLTGTQFDQIRIVGGGSRNSLLNQFTADATERRVLAGPAEATALGNIAVQLVALGAVASLDEAREVIQRSFPPAAYEPAQTAVWKSAYRNFQSLLSQSAGTPV